MIGSISALMAFFAPLGFTPAKKAEPKYGSLDHLIEWLETKNPKDSYPWYSPSRCLIGEYGTEFQPERSRDKHTNFSWAREQFWKNIPLFEFGPDNGTEMPGDIAAHTPWTYGAALDRAKAYKKRYHI